MKLECSFCMQDLSPPKDAVTIFDGYALCLAHFRLHKFAEPVAIEAGRDDQ